MRIVKSYNSPCDEYIIRDIEAVYKALTSEEIKQGDRYDAKMVERIISWLPCIVEIEMHVSYDNEWLNITFSNHQTIGMLYNTGAEDGLLTLFEPEKPEVLEYDIADKKGFILNAKGCEFLYAELEKLERRISKKVLKQTDKWNEQIAHIMTYESEEEIRDEYGYGYITEEQCRKYIELFQKGKELQNEPIETHESVALSILHMMMSDVRKEGWQHKFDALSPEEQVAELQRAEEQRHKLRSHKYQVQKALETKNQ